VVQAAQLKKITGGKEMEATSIRGPANYGGQQKAMLMRNEGASESFVAMLGSQASLQGQALLLVVLLLFYCLLIDP
jgi:hypothetical protein